MGLLSNKVAIVTGAASGFGAAISRMYEKEGAKVVVADLNEDGANKIAGELNGNAIAVKCDVSVRADIDALVAAATKQFGTIDIVVNMPAIPIVTVRCLTLTKPPLTVVSTSM